MMPHGRSIGRFRARHGATLGKKLYVGNLGRYVASVDLAQLFTPHGIVQSAQVVEDQGSGRSRGFGFVEMGSDVEAGHAIAALNGEELDGLALTVIEARPRAPRPGSGAGGTKGRR
jgi:cold-inducible RNA-binding protein